MKIFTNTLLTLALLIVPASFALADAEKKPPLIIAASATSSAQGSAPVTCLLDPACQGYWQPQSVDAGTNEGIYLRFQEPTHFNFIEITTETELPEGQGFTVVLDTQTSFELTQNAEKDEVERLIKQIAVYRSAETGTFKYIANALILVQDRDIGYAEPRDYWQPLDYSGQSVFINLNGSAAPGTAVPKITSIRFSDQPEHYEPALYEPAPNAPAVLPLEYMPLELPSLIPATAVASSTLEPAFAYNTAKLFDSQADMAWSTDGKKTDGPGETIKVTFETEQTIHGLMLWNGYQRSTTHFLANARVKTLRLGQQSIKVQDIQGPQSIQLTQPLKTNELILEIADIYPGGSYKDVLISELRFLGPDNKLLLPVLPPVAPTPPPALAEFLDRRFDSFIQDIMLAEPLNGECMDDCIFYNASLRLRTNGSFVVYTRKSYGSSYGRDDSSAVIEGNWEALADDRLRLFGKTYQPNRGVNFSSYLKDDPSQAEKKDIAPPRIFQSVMSLGRFSALSQAEKENAVLYMLQSRLHDYDGEEETLTLSAERPASLRFDIANYGYVGAADLNTAIQNIVAELNRLDPLYVKSDIFTELLLP